MQQDLALNILKSWRNVFLTGQAWSGKTYVINQYIDRLWSQDIDVAITASTGIAATHIWGVTIHSWSGIGIKSSLSHRDLDNIENKEHVNKQVNKAKVLIIDEISMLSAQTLDMVDQVCQYIRRNKQPCGGLQVVLIGDFFQLPPVMSRDHWSDTKRFAFAAKVWKQLELVTCYLQTQYRQSDTSFQTILNELRIGEISNASLQTLQSRLHSDLDHASPTRLFTHNADVDKINNEHLVSLSWEMITHHAQGEWDPKLIAAIIKSILPPDVLQLKRWARVMFVKNNHQKGYVNGTLGTVTDFDHAWLPLVEVWDGRVIKAEPEQRSIENATEIVAQVTHLPLKLAWAMTVHKSQGMTLDAAEMDLSKVFEPWQAYVALSRIKSLDGLRLLGLNTSWLSAHPLVVRGEAYFSDQSEQIAKQFGQILDDDRQEIHKKFVTSVGGTYTSTTADTFATDNAQDDKQKKLSDPSSWTTKPKRKGPTVKKGESMKVTLAHIQEKKTIEEIAEVRGLTVATIFNHLFKLVAQEPGLSLTHLKPHESQITAVKKAIKKISPNDFDTNGRPRLTPIHTALEWQMSYDEIKLCLLFI